MDDGEGGGRRGDVRGHADAVGPAVSNDLRLGVVGKAMRQGNVEVPGEHGAPVLDALGEGVVGSLE